MGPSVAQDMVETFLPYKSGGENYVTEDMLAASVFKNSYTRRKEVLAKPLGAKAAQKEVEQALRDLFLPFDERRPYALQIGRAHV